MCTCVCLCLRVYMCNCVCMCACVHACVCCILFVLYGNVCSFRSVLLSPLSLFLKLYMHLKVRRLHFCFICQLCLIIAVLFYFFLQECTAYARATVELRKCQNVNVIRSATSRLQQQLIAIIAKWGNNWYYNIISNFYYLNNLCFFYMCIFFV